VVGYVFVSTSTQLKVLVLIQLYHEREMPSSKCESVATTLCSKKYSVPSKWKSCHVGSGDALFIIVVKKKDKRPPLSSGKYSLLFSRVSF
jgi:hypothetical protein